MRKVQQFLNTETLELGRGEGSGDSHRRQLVHDGGSSVLAVSMHRRSYRSTCVLFLFNPLFKSKASSVSFFVCSLRGSMSECLGRNLFENERGIFACTQTESQCFMRKPTTLGTPYILFFLYGGTANRSHVCCVKPFQGVKILINCLK